MIALCGLIFMPNFAYSCPPDTTPSNQTTKIKPSKNNNAYALTLQGFNLYLEGKHEEAITAFEQVINIQPDLAQAWFGKGLALYDLKRYEESIAFFDKATNLEKDFAKSWYFKGLALTQLNQHEKALISFNQAIKFEKNNADIWLAKSMTLTYLNRYKESISSSTQAIKLNPELAEAYVVRGGAYGLTLQKTKAIADFNKAITLFKNQKKYDLAADTSELLEKVKQFP